MINEHFKPIFNAEMATQVVFQRFLSTFGRHQRYYLQLRPGNIQSGIVPADTAFIPGSVKVGSLIEEVCALAAASQPSRSLFPTSCFTTPTLPNNHCRYFRSGT